MSHEQVTATDWMVSNVKDVVGVNAEQVKETSKLSLDASRAVIDVYRDAASILRDRGDDAFRAGIAVMEAAFDANLEHFNRLADVKNLADLIRLQMMWGANQTLAICHALSRSNEPVEPSGVKPGVMASA